MRERINRGEQTAPYIFKTLKTHNCDVIYFTNQNQDFFFTAVPRLYSTTLGIFPTKLFTFFFTCYIRGRLCRGIYMYVFISQCFPPRYNMLNDYDSVSSLHKKKTVRKRYDRADTRKRICWKNQLPDIRTVGPIEKPLKYLLDWQNFLFRLFFTTNAGNLSLEKKIPDLLFAWSN